jgi:excisionase family DNA binding protein
MASINQILDVRGGAALLLLSPTTIYRLAWQNKIPYKRIEGRLRFHREVLEDFIKAGGDGESK